MVRFILFIDYIFFLLVRLTRVLYLAWTDILLLILDHSKWEFVNCECYRRTNYYNKNAQSLGLYLWESISIEKYFPKAPAKILILAAGSGREASALLRHGYSICACEIVDSFRDILNQLCGNYPKDQLSVLNYSFEDIINSTDCNYDLKADAVIIGHGAISHLASRKLQLALLCKIAETCPNSVILLSWLKYKKRPRWQRYWRYYLYKLSKKWITKFTGYAYGCGPVNYSTLRYMQALIKDAGFELLHIDDLSTQPHAVCRTNSNA